MVDTVLFSLSRYPANRIRLPHMVFYIVTNVNCINETVRELRMRDGTRRVPSSSLRNNVLLELQDPKDRRHHQNFSH